MSPARKYLLLSVLTILFICFPGSSYAATIFSNTVGTAQGTIDGAPGADEAVATKFTASDDYDLTGVSICAATQGSPADGLRARIVNDSAGVPGSTTFATSATIPAGSYTSGNCADQSTTITGSIVAGTYWFIIERTGARSTSNNYVYGDASTGSNNKAVSSSSVWTASARNVRSSLSGDIVVPVGDSIPAGTAIVLCFGIILCFFGFYLPIRIGQFIDSRGIM